MSKLHVTLIASLLAAAATLGAIAVTHTVKLGAANRASTETTVLTRTKRLDQFEASLRRALAHKPPALPAIPKTTAVSSAAAPAAAPQPRVVYRRPPPIVVVRHTQHGDDGFEREASGEGNDD
jgi:aminoglycoside phosphotransferase (APT) family kinase protein